MSDQEFVAEWVPHTFAARIQRAAVLYRLESMAHSPAEIVEKTLSLVTKWRARLSRLQDGGWLPRNDAGGSVFARNCPPSFAFMRPHLRPCRMSHFCPFCYARWVAEVWARVDAAFPNPRDEAPPDHSRIADGGEIPGEIVVSHGRRAALSTEELAGLQGREFPFHLVERRYVRQLACGDAPAEDFIRQAMQHVIRQRRPQIEKYGPIGAFQFVTFEPDQWDSWRVHYRTLAMIRADQPTPGWRGRVARIEQPTRKEIFKAVARVCTYPGGLLYGNPDQTIAFLRGRRMERGPSHRAVGLRLSAMFGAFRHP